MSWGVIWAMGTSPQRWLMSLMRKRFRSSVLGDQVVTLRYASMTLANVVARFLRTVSRRSSVPDSKESLIFFARASASLRLLVFKLRSRCLPVVSR